MVSDEEFIEMIEQAQRETHAVYLLLWLAHLLPEGESFRKAPYLAYGLGDPLD